jgi:hypothetical protein
MKIILSLCLLISFLSNQDLPDLRKQFVKAATSKTAADDFHTKMTDISKENSKTLVAYKGASKAIMGKFVTKQAEKKKYFTEGVQLIEFAINSEPKNIEIRVIRLCIQENTPKIVKYKANINEDKDFILQNYRAQNSALKEYIKSYIVQSKVFSETEKAKLFNN